MAFDLDDDELRETRKIKNLNKKTEGLEQVNTTEEQRITAELKEVNK